jgi:ABC transporter fused permease/ATP-binding protein
VSTTAGEPGPASTSPPGADATSAGTSTPSADPTGIGADAASADATGADDRSRRSLRILGRLIELLRPHWPRFVVAVLTLLAASAISLAYPQVASLAVDVGMGQGSLAELDRITLILCVAFVGHAGLIWLRHYTMSWLGERVVADLRVLVVDRLLTLPLAWFHERRTGELVGRLSSDVTVVEGVVGTELSMALRNLLQLVGGLIFLFVIDAKLTLSMLAVIPPIVLVTVYFGKSIRRRSKDVQDELARVSGTVQESLGAIATVQAFVRERHEAGRYRQGVEGAFARTLQLVRWRASFFATATAAGYLAVAAMIWMGGRAMIAGDLTAGELTKFFLYTFLVAGALAEISSLWGSLQRAAGATERLFAIIDTVPAIRDPAAPAPLPAGGGAVEFDHVEFTYAARPDAPVLRDVSLTVAPGQVVALVGPSGSGKSTLLHLLLRFDDVAAGAVRLDGADVRTLRLAELRRAMAMVAQEPVLFAGTIRANIAYAVDDASDAAVEQAARDAGAHDFITGFPDGYATMIGERGVKLSGGQKQRLAIARALLADPRVLILDEATSNLDAESEAQVQAALARLMKGRTTLVVAHRLSTVRDADRIVVLDGGRVVESGRHDELMARAGVYRRLVEHQVIGEPRPAATAV